MASPPPTPQSLTDTSDLPNLEVPPDHHGQCPQLDPEPMSSWHWD